MPPLLRLALVLSFTTSLLAGCSVSDPGLPPPVDRDLSAIRGDTLTVLTAYNSTSYFLYRGEPMGYEYELLQAFAEAHDLPLGVRVVRNLDSLYHHLNRGEGDVVAARRIVAPADTPHVAFTHALYRTPPALVQRSRPPTDSTVIEAADSLMAIEADSVAAIPSEPVTVRGRLITKPAGLAGEDVHMQPSSAYVDQLLELSDSLTRDIDIIEVEGTVKAESLIRAVSLDRIDLTVTQHNLAELKESYFGNVAAHPTLGEPSDVAWAVRKNAPALRDTLNAWLASEEGKRIARVLYTKYYVDRRGYQERIADDYLTSETGRLSPYDALFQTYADSVGWDWLLLASQAFQESRFRPTARSWAGASGLLQLMPATAREFGVQSVYDPEDNVAGAVRFIEWLQNYWEGRIADPTERLKFVLASYNTGHGHVEDARRLTEKYGDDPDVWEDVAYWLLQKSKREYYSDPVVKYGFARGLEPVTYVSRILDRYSHYEQFVLPEAATEAAADATAAQEQKQALQREPVSLSLTR